MRLTQGDLTLDSVFGVLRLPQIHVLTGADRVDAYTYPMCEPCVGQVQFDGLWQGTVPALQPLDQFSVDTGAIVLPPAIGETTITTPFTFRYTQGKVRATGHGTAEIVLDARQGLWWAESGRYTLTNPEPSSVLLMLTAFVIGGYHARKSNVRRG